MTDVAAAEPIDPRFRRIGRWFAIALFSVTGGWILVACITSVVMALYSKPPTMHGGALEGSDRNYCVRTIVGLRDELEVELTNVAQPVKPGIDAGARWSTWDGSFHKRFDEARARCAQDDQLDGAYDRLAVMYESYARAAGNILQTRATVAPQLADVVELLKD